MSTISVEARYLALVEDGHEVLWQSNRDLGSVLHRGVKAGIDVPSTAEGGFILIGLDVGQSQPDALGLMLRGRSSPG